MLGCRGGGVRWAVAWGQLSSPATYKAALQGTRELQI